MRKTLKKTYIVMLICLLPACAGLSRSCSSDIATSFGADWLIVQLNAFGEVIRCWQLRDVSVTNEPASDGIYWKDTFGNLVHISGQYNRVQVLRDSWSAAFQTLGMRGESCEENMVDKSKKEKP